MTPRAAAFAVVLAAGCASDVDLQLGLHGDGPDGGPAVSTSVGPLRAARVLPGPAEAWVPAIAWHPASLVIAGGTFVGTTDLGTGPVGDGDSHMGFVAAYDPFSAAPVWTHAFTRASATDPPYALTASGINDIAIATDGTVYAVGSFGGTIDFGGGPIESSACGDGVVARYAPDGTPLEPFTLPQGFLVAGAAMPDGGLIASGQESIGDCPGSGGESTAEYVLVRFDALGQVEWKIFLGSALAERIVTSPDGDILIDGQLVGTLTIGDLSVTGIDPRVGDTFMARLHSDGTPAWLTSCVRTALEGSCGPGDIGFTADGRVLAIGSFVHEVNLSGVILDAGDDTIFERSYVAELGARGEATVLAVQDGAMGYFAIRSDPFELVATSAGPSIRVLAGATTLVSEQVIGAGEFGGGAADGVASGPAGEIALSGWFYNDADFGAGPISSTPEPGGGGARGDDGFIAIYERPEVD